MFLEYISYIEYVSNIRAVVTCGARDKNFIFEAVAVNPKVIKNG